MSLLVVVELAARHFDMHIDARILFVGNVDLIPKTRDGRRLTRLDAGDRSLIVFLAEFKLCHRVLPSELIAEWTAAADRRHQAAITSEGPIEQRDRQ
jgi:hypothetical protein